MSGSSGNNPPAESASSTINTHPSEAKVNQGTLTLVLVGSEPDSEDHYAVVPFPETYEVPLIPSHCIPYTMFSTPVNYQDAVATAIKALGRYMDNPESAVILRCSVQNRKGDWIWADILPDHWRVTLERNRTEVGIFKQPSSVGFLYGSVKYTRGEGGTKTEWSSLIKESGRRGPEPEEILMDRPENYAVSISLYLRPLVPQLSLTKISS